MAYILKDLVDLYRSDQYSPFRHLSYQVRIKQDRLLTRIVEEHGTHSLRSIRTQTLLAWHKAWSSGGKVAMANEMMARLRALFRFGFVMLEDRDCLRLHENLTKTRFRSLGPRMVQLTAEHVRAIRSAAHRRGWGSIALAQALQFELLLSQKDVIGEWVPKDEPGESKIVWRGQKWLRGLCWSNIDRNLVLRHRTGSSGRRIEADLKTAPMVKEELKRYAGDGIRSIIAHDLPLVLNELTGMPWSTAEFRRKWRILARMAGVPDIVKNRDGVPAGMIGGAPYPERATTSQAITLKRLGFTLRTLRR